jgi:hypothetical protein
MLSEIACLGVGIVIGMTLTAAAYRKARRTIAAFWKKAYDNELKKHAQTKECHEATIQNIAGALHLMGYELLLNGKAIELSKETIAESEEWPDLIEIKDA